MPLHLYLVLSVNTPIIFQPQMKAATYERKGVSSSIYIKLFSCPLTPEEDITTTASNSGDQGVATLVVKKEVVRLKKNQSIPDLEEKYPQLDRITELARSLANQLNLNNPKDTSICDFAKNAERLENVVIHGIKNP